MKLYFYLLFLIAFGGCQSLHKNYSEHNFILTAYTNSLFQITVKDGFTVKATDQANKMVLESVDTLDKKVTYNFHPIIPGNIRFEVFKKEKSKEKIYVWINKRPDPIIYFGGSSSKDSIGVIKLDHLNLFGLFCKDDRNVPINSTYSIKQFKVKVDSSIFTLVNTSKISLTPSAYKKMIESKEKFIELFDFKVKGAYDSLILKDRLKIRYQTESILERDLSCLQLEKQTINIGTKEITEDNKDVEVLKDPEKCQQLVVTLDGTQNYIYIFDESGKRIVSEAIYSDGPTRINISDFSGTYRLEFGGDIGDTYRFNLIVK